VFSIMWSLGRSKLNSPVHGFLFSSRFPCTRHLPQHKWSRNKRTFGNIKHLIQEKTVLTGKVWCFQVSRKLLPWSQRTVRRIAVFRSNFQTAIPYKNSNQLLFPKLCSTRMNLGKLKPLNANWRQRTTFSRSLGPGNPISRHLTHGACC
jgi:hypothetical protein